MSHILNIESATSICSVCISQNGNMLSLRETHSNKHATEITRLIDECLKDIHLKISQLSAVAISHGPGSYTSLRVGASTAKGICYALNIPMIAVDTLQSLAMAAYLKYSDKEAFYCPMIDARRMEVYTALFKIEHGNLIKLEPTSPLILTEKSFNNLLDNGSRLIYSGNGVEKSKSVINSHMAILSDIECSSENMIPLSTIQFNNADFVDIAYYTPEYLKPPNITNSRKII